MLESHIIMAHLLCLPHPCLDERLQILQLVHPHEPRNLRQIITAKARRACWRKDVTIHQQIEARRSERARTGGRSGATNKNTLSPASRQRSVSSVRICFATGKKTKSFSERRVSQRGTHVCTFFYTRVSFSFNHYSGTRAKASETTKKKESKHNPWRARERRTIGGGERWRHKTVNVRRHANDTRMEEGGSRLPTVPSVRTYMIAGFVPKYRRM